MIFPYLNTNFGNEIDITTSRQFSSCISPHVRLGTQGLVHQSARQISRKDYQFPELVESDLEEKFVIGSGPGGQAVQKTSNCCVLKHIPTGIVVKSHESRSLESNRKTARQKLIEKLDIHINGENSFSAQEAKEARDAKEARKRKNKKNLEIKKAFKEKMGLD